AGVEELRAGTTYPFVRQLKQGNSSSSVVHSIYGSLVLVSSGDNLCEAPPRGTLDLGPIQWRWTLVLAIVGKGCHAVNRYLTNRKVMTVRFSVGSVLPYSESELS